MNEEIAVPASECMRHITLKVRLTGLKVLQVRLWLACKLLSLAARVAGCGIHVEGVQE